MPKFTKQKYQELILLYVYFVLVSLISIILKLNLLVFDIIFLLFPAIYFSLKTKNLVKNSIETLVFSIPYGIFVDYFARLSRTWESVSIFSFRLFDLVTIEIQIWGICYTLLVISCYKYFFEKYPAKKVSKNAVKFLYLTIFCAVIFTIIYLLKINPLLPYYYLQLNLIWTGIIIVGLFKYKKLFTKVILIGAYFFPFSILHEIVSLELGHWYFIQGNHIGYINILQKYIFPIEELHWLIFVIPVMILLHEYFVDNKK